MNVRLLLLSIVLLAAACAQTGRPPGGPVDETPPRLGTVEPGSLATRVSADAPLSFAFSEKVDRRKFVRSLLVIPDLPLESPEFKDNTVSVRARRGWPADTLVVWVLLPSLPDRHRVPMGEGRTGAFTTGVSLPTGAMRGTASLDSLVHSAPDGPDWSKLRARLTLDPVGDSRKRRPWRFADGSADGSFQLNWIEAPSGPYRLEVFLDTNGDAKRDEREPVATVDSLFLAEADSTLELDASLLRLVDLEGPVPVSFCAGSADSAVADSVRLAVWSWTDQGSRPRQDSIDSTGCIDVELSPGPVRWGAWLDLDGDLGWSRTADGTSEPFVAMDTLTIDPATPARVLVTWPVERIPWATLDSLAVPPVPRELWSASSR